VRGIEAQVDWRNEAGLRIFSSYAFTDIDSDDAKFASDRLNYEDSAPRHSFSLLASQDFGHGWEASLNYHFQSDMQWFYDKPIDSYHQLDVRLAKRFQRGGNKAVIAELVGTHLIEPVSDYLPNQEWDRGVFFRLSLDL
jgi:outer membrane receptor protein involved in Fe transport